MSSCFESPDGRPEIGSGLIGAQDRRRSQNDPAAPTAEPRRVGNLRRPGETDAVACQRKLVPVPAARAGLSAFLLGLRSEKVEPLHAVGGRFHRRPAGCLPPSAQRLGPPHRVFLAIAALHGQRQIIVGHLNFKATRRRLLGADDVAARAPETPTNDGVTHACLIPNAVPLDVTDNSQNVGKSPRQVVRPCSVSRHGWHLLRGRFVSLASAGVKEPAAG